VFSDSIQFEFPVSEATREELRRFQQILELGDEEVAQLEEKVASQNERTQNQSQQADNLQVLENQPSNAASPPVQPQYRQETIDLSQSAARIPTDSASSLTHKTRNTKSTTQPSVTPNSPITPSSASVPRSQPFSPTNRPNQPSASRNPTISAKFFACCFVFFLAFSVYFLYFYRLELIDFFTPFFVRDGSLRWFPLAIVLWWLGRLLVWSGRFAVRIFRGVTG